MRELTLRQEARAELLEAIAWYEAERPGLGGRFNAEVERLLARILESPRQFPEIDPGIRRGLVRGFPYGLFFAAQDEVDDEILVLAVLHLHRDPPTWKNRS